MIDVFLRVDNFLIIVVWLFRFDLFLRFFMGGFFSKPDTSAQDAALAEAERKRKEAAEKLEEEKSARKRARRRGGLRGVLAFGERRGDKKETLG